jgi:hypothetical protein
VSKSSQARAAPTSRSPTATKKVCTSSRHELQRASAESSNAPAPTCAVSEPSTREDSGVSCHGQRSIAISGKTKNTTAAAHAPMPNSRAARSTLAGTSGSPGLGSPESVRRLRHQSAPTANGDTT